MPSPFRLSTTLKYARGVLYSRRQENKPGTCGSLRAPEGGGWLASHQAIIAKRVPSSLTGKYTYCKAAIPRNSRGFLFVHLSLCQDIRM